MPDGILAVGAYLGAGGTAGAAVGASDAALSAAALDASVAGSGTLVGPAVAGGGAITAGGGGGSLLAAAVPAAASAAASAGVTSMLSPKPPKIPGALPMPDALDQENARKRAIAESMARRGRASTVLTAPAAGTLGG